jgi:hypothetical protein
MGVVAMVAVAMVLTMGDMGVVWGVYLAAAVVWILWVV